MPLRDSAIRHFIIRKDTIILLSHFLSFYFKCFKVAAVMLVIDFVVKWYKIEESTESGTRYFISFKDGQGKSHELEVSEQFFMEFRQMERRNRNLF